MSAGTLNDLFYDALKDIYYAERKILRALPKMARAAEAEAVREAFLKHRDETETHMERLQEVFEILGKRPQGKTCPAIDGILEEGQEIIEEMKEKPGLDAGLLAGALADTGNTGKPGNVTNLPVPGRRPPTRPVWNGTSDWWPS